MPELGDDIGISVEVADADLVVTRRRSKPKWQAEVRQALLGSHANVMQGVLLPSGPSLCRGISVVVMGSKANVLLLAAPVAIFGVSLGVSDPTVFIAALLTLVPCAERLGYVTEQLASHTNDTVGGLLNATFGNATEVLVACFALHRGLHRVVQLSLLGSILSNLLLVLGAACFIGGLRWKVQTFKIVSGAVPSAMLMLATTGLLLPAALKMSGQEDDREDEINFSRFSAGVMLVMYAGYLVFQLRTHTEEFEGEPSPSTSPTGAEEEPRPTLGVWESVVWMAAITFLVSHVSEALVGTIEGFTRLYHINSVFVSAVVIPIMGNAAEHAAAVIFAFRNRMDICMGIAVGSSTQIALLVLPFCVLLGWAMDRPLSLFFNGFETASLLCSVATVTLLLHGGTSNWLIGLLLMGAYLIVACGFWVHELESLQEAKGLPESKRAVLANTTTSPFF
eukprot:Sspe_Gene.24245::Locus_9577_Transcript_1_1_Confidence_1.000_Length_1432::g.24245::m.24245/K07300/chaA, CAX; Ca2+:H+ antiporter